MNKKWIPLLFPISLMIIAMTASGQMSQFSKAVFDSDNQHPNNQGILPDTTFAPVPADSTYANLHNGWYKAPGQMPIFIPGQLPNSMPNLIPPPVDEEMIIHVGHTVADSLKTPDSDDK